MTVHVIQFVIVSEHCIYRRITCKTCLFAGMTVFVVSFKRFESVEILQYYCYELPFVNVFDLYKWKFLSPVSIVHNRFVVFYQINRRVINGFNSKYGAAKSHRQMYLVVSEHFYESVFDRLSLA